MHGICQLVLAAVMVIAMVSTVLADNRARDVRAELSGYEEVHFIAGPPPALRGAISTEAHGSFRARIDERAQVIHYELSYAGFETDVTQAHIHFGQLHTVGGIVVWLCQTPGVPAVPLPDVPLCPEREGTVTGTITPEKVLAPAGQGFTAGNFEELLRAIRAGATYANVHSVEFGPGEIRGQIGTGRSPHH